MKFIEDVPIPARILACTTAVAGFVLSQWPPELSRDALVVIWLLIATVFIGNLIYVLTGRHRRRFMTVMWAVALGASLGAIAGLVSSVLYPTQDEPDRVAQKNGDSKDGTVAEPAAAADDDPTALLISRSAGPVMVTVAPLIPDPNQRTADPSDLQFYFFAFMSAAQGNNVQYAKVTITNRSPRKMHLEMWGQVDYWKDNGEPARYGMPAEWNPKDMKEGTGQTFIDLDEWETKRGRVGLFLGNPEEHGLSKWYLDANENVYLEVFDAVTGKRAAFKAMSGYPVDQMPSPLPSHKQLLALEFPAFPALDPQSDSVPVALDLLLRTRDQMYNSSGKWSVSAMFKNNSPDRMELKVNLLNRSSPDETTWRTHEGRFKPSADGSSEQQSLTIQPNGIVDGSLVFADTGFANQEGHQLNTKPMVSLFEISDSVSGKKVWCAVFPGYPPDTDMRSATILENPRAIPNNASEDALKDSK